MILTVRRPFTPFPLPATATELRRRETEAVAALREEWRWTDGAACDFMATILADEDKLLDWAELKRQASAARSDTLVVSLVSKEYAPVGVNWLRHVRELGLSNALLVCGDPESQAYFNAQNALCVLAHLPSDSSGGRMRAGFTNRGMMMANLKFMLCRRLLELGYNVVFSDIDAFWLRDPIPFLMDTRADFAYQLIYQLPKVLVRTWGHAVCSGFFFLRGRSAASLRFIRACEVELASLQDDQVAMNVALAEQRIAWRYPAAEPTPRLSERRLGPLISPFLRPWMLHGVTKTIAGTSEITGLEVAALPQCLVRRHLYLRIPLADALVLHPNSPKESAGKLEVFRRLGLRVVDGSV